VIGSLLVLSQSKVKKVKSKRAHQAMRLRKALTNKDCTPQEVLLAIDDMYITEEDL
jgi:hypothetical protein